MRIFLTACAALLITSCSAEKTPASQAEPLIEASQNAAHTPAQEQTGVLAVITYADWCSSCKILDPKVETVRARGEIDGVTYLVLDFSEKDAEGTLAVADKAGVGPAVRGHFGNEILTGEVLLVDRAQNKIISVVKKTMTEDEIEAAIKAAAASV